VKSLDLYSNIIPGSARIDGIIVYKIVECDARRRLKTLFHGNGGTRVLPRNQWLEAEHKHVRDAKTWYVSGWHVFKSFATARAYLARFTNRDTKAIVRCRARGLRDKSHSPYDVLLADELLIERIVWRATWKEEF